MPQYFIKFVHHSLIRKSPLQFGLLSIYKQKFNIFITIQCKYTIKNDLFMSHCSSLAVK